MKASNCKLLDRTLLNELITSDKAGRCVPGRGKSMHTCAEIRKGMAHDRVPSLTTKSLLQAHG